MNKYLAFAKNVTITAAVAVSVAAGASEIADYFTDNGLIIGAVSTVSQYVSMFATFLPLHAKDNKDLYLKNNEFQ